MLEARKAEEGRAHATSLITESESTSDEGDDAPPTPSSSTIFRDHIIYSPVRETLSAIR